MHRADLAVERGRFAVDGGQRPSKAVHERVKLVERAGHVLADIDAARGEVGKQGSETRDLLVRLMAAVVNHNVHARYLGHEPLPKLRVGLVADEHAHTFAFVRVQAGSMSTP